VDAHSADPSNILDNYFQFDTLSGLVKSRRSFMLLIWFASTWVIWNERNAKIFLEKKLLLYHFWKK